MIILARDMFPSNHNKSLQNGNQSMDVLESKVQQVIADSSPFNDSSIRRLVNCSNAALRKRNDPDFRREKKRRRIIVPVSTMSSSSQNTGGSWWKYGCIEKDVIKDIAFGNQSENSAALNEFCELSPRPIAPNSVEHSSAHGLFAQSIEPQLNSRLSTMTLSPGSSIPLSASGPARIYDSNQLSDEDASSDGSVSLLKFRAYQAESWSSKFDDLVNFRKKYGHCLVPNAYPDNPSLAQWVKRQRYQYKLKIDGKRSTVSDERIAALEEIGFVWDSHRAVWDERLNELLQYKAMNGDCNVPSRFVENRQLAVWVKRQRRQYKFFCTNKPSSMTPERISRLESVGFEWDLRCRED